MATIDHLAHDLQASLRSAEIVVETDELWAYGDGRSCRFAAGGRCGFLLGRVEIARGELDAGSAATSAALWLGGATIAELEAATGIDAVPHADLLESGDVAGWHWCTTLDRARGPLARLRGLLERASERPRILPFTPFTTLIHLGLSRSAHAPYVTEGMPLVTPVDGGPDTPATLFDLMTREGPVCRGDATEVVLMLEQVLARAPGAPFVGCRATLVQCDVDAELARAGSALRAALEPRRGGVEVAISAGGRRCVVRDGIDGARVTLFEPRRRAYAELCTPGLPVAVAAALRWVEDGASLGVVRAVDGVELAMPA